MVACDFRIASLESRIGFPEIRLGALPAAGGMKRLVRELGAMRAREFVLLGKSVDAAKAAEIGLINAAVPATELDQAVERLVEDIVSLPASSLRAAKRAIAAIAAGGEADTIEAEAFGSLFRTPDLAEGLAAFVEKRKPRFNRNDQG
jgi:enoyl-CoA hydratase/carnithine racemase